MEDMKNPLVSWVLKRLTGSKELSKSICKDRIIGTWKARNMEVLPPMKY